MEETAETKKEHRSTGRVLDVLELVASSKEGYTLTGICTALNVPKSSMFPIIHTLQERNFLSFDKLTSRYTIGSSAFQIGNSFLEHFDIMQQIEEEMQNIVNICMETCHFATLVEGDVLYLKKTDSLEPIRMISTVGKRIPAYGTGLGKALLVDYSADDLKKLYPNGLKQLTSHTVKDIYELERQLEQVRMDGVAYEVEESNDFIRCIAIPIRKNNKVIAALSIAMPTFRYKEEKNELEKHLLINAKRKIEYWLTQVNADFSGIT